MLEPVAFPSEPAEDAKPVDIEPVEPETGIVPEDAAAPEEAKFTEASEAGQSSAVGTYAGLQPAKARA
jgi:hypothetical protein